MIKLKGNIYSHIIKEKAVTVMSLLKDIYNEEFAEALLNRIKSAYPAFERDKCRALMFQEDLRTDVKTADAPDHRLFI